MKMRDILFAIFTSIIATGRLCMAVVSEDDFFQVFDLMEEYGNNAKNELQKQNITWKQYLTVFITSEEDITDKTYETSFKTHNASRLRVKFNEKRNNSRADHGEILAMEELEGMVKIFQKPLVFLFSYYIPCAEVKHLGYSCAEKLGEYQKTHPFPLILAYKTIYKGTDGRKAVRFLTNAGIKTLEKMPGGAYYKPSSIFQKSFYECLMQSPKASACCTGDEENRRNIVAFDVNMATNKVRNLKLTKGLDKMKYNAVKNVKDCFISNLDLDIGSDCSFCQNDSVIKSAITHCAESSFNISTMFGVKKGDNYPYDSMWVENKGLTLSQIYDQNPVDAGMSRSMVMCEQRKNSLQSLCTKQDSELLKRQQGEFSIELRNDKRIKQEYILKL